MTQEEKEYIETLMTMLRLDGYDVQVITKDNYEEVSTKYVAELNKTKIAILHYKESWYEDMGGKFGHYVTEGKVVISVTTSWDIKQIISRILEQIK